MTNLPVKVHFVEEELIAAISFIKENNPAAVSQNWSEAYIRNSIMNSIRSMTEDTTYIGTMGYIIMNEDNYKSDGYKNICISIYVNPNISYDSRKPCTYMSAYVA